MQLNVDHAVLSDLINQAEARPFSYERLLNSHDQGSIEYKTLKIIGELVSYIDKNAAMKNILNEYPDKRTIALAFVRQNVWVKYLLKFKQGTGLEELPDVIQNAFRYIEHPDQEIAVLKGQRRRQIREVLFEGQDGYQWDEFRENGIMAIGWDEIGDLTLLESKEKIINELIRIYGPKSGYMNDGLALRQF